MSDTTAVDTAALTGAAATASRLSGDVLAAAGVSGPALARLASELAGARSGPEVSAVRQASDGVLGDLGHTLARLSAVLRAAALEYADAEDSAVEASTARPSSGSSASGGAGPVAVSGRRLAQ